MGVNFRDSDGTVSKHFLNVPYVDIRLKQAGSESVAEHMWRYMKVNGGEGTILFKHTSDGLVRKLGSVGIGEKISAVIYFRDEFYFVFLRSIKTSLLPIWIIRSFEPFPYMRIAAIFKSTSTFLKLHSSEILTPVENNVSHIAISRRVRFLR